VVQIGVAGLLIAGDGRDEQPALRCKAPRKVQQLKLASLVHGGGKQELEGLLNVGRLGVEEGGEGLECGVRLSRQSGLSSLG